MTHLNMLKMIGLLLLLLIALTLPSVLPKASVVQQDKLLYSEKPPESTA